MNETGVTGTESGNCNWYKVAAVCIIAAGCLAYANTLTNGFVWDDASSLLLHKHVQDPTKFFRLFAEDQHAFGRGQGNFYRPLVSVSFMLDFFFTRPNDWVPQAGIPNPNPALYHITNTLWHILAALGFLALLRRMGAPVGVWMTAPLLFVAHPLHTEAITYISGRADPMSAAFMFAAVCLALPGDDGKTGKGSLILGGLCFVGGLLSKESATILPVLMAITLAASFMMRKSAGETPGAARTFTPLGIAVALFVAYAVLRTTVLKFVVGQGASQASGFGQRVLEAGMAFAEYIRLLFVPTHLHMERTLDGMPAWTAALGWLLIAAIIAGAVLLWRARQHRAALGLVWFIVAWLPISGLFPLNAPMAEHWMYMPMAGFWWALAEVAVWAARNRSMQVAAGAAAYALLLLFLALSAQRNRDWKDNESIYRATLRENPKSLRVQYNLAVTYSDILKNPAGAKRHYQRVIELAELRQSAFGGTKMLGEEEIESHLSLGKLFFAERDYYSAAKHYALIAGIGDERFKPVAGSASLGLGEVLVAMGDMRRANEAFKRAVTLCPDLQAQVQRAYLKGLSST